MNFPILIQLEFFVIAILILFFLVFAGVIIGHRNKRNRRDIRRKKLQINMESWLFEIIHNDDFVKWAEKPESAASLHRYLAASYADYSDKLLFIDILVHESTTFSGDIGERITKVFYMLELDKIVLDELKDGEWNDKANAMKVAAAMKMEEADNRILHYINAPNQILRQEARIAYISTNTANLQYLLDRIKQPVSEWEIIQIINVISKNKNAYLLYFKPVFDKSNPSVSLLSLRIINYFTLTRFSVEVARQLDATNEAIVNMAIQTLGVLNYASALPIFKIKYPILCKNSRLSALNIFSTLGTHADIDFLVDVIKNKPDNSHILIAIKALLNIGASEMYIEEQLKEDVDRETLQKMIMHNLDKRIVRYA